MSDTPKYEIADWTNTVKKLSAEALRKLKTKHCVVRIAYPEPDELMAKYAEDAAEQELEHAEIAGEYVAALNWDTIFSWYAKALLHRLFAIPRNVVTYAGCDRPSQFNYRGDHIYAIIPKESYRLVFGKEYSSEDAEMWQLDVQVNRMAPVACDHGDYMAERQDGTICPDGKYRCAADIIFEFARHIANEESYIFDEAVTLTHREETPSEKPASAAEDSVDTTTQTR